MSPFYYFREESNYSYSSSALSRTRLPGQQSQQRLSDFPLPRHFHVQGASEKDVWPSSGNWRRRSSSLSLSWMTKLLSECPAFLLSSLHYNSRFVFVSSFVNRTQDIQTSPPEVGTLLQPESISHPFRVQNHGIRLGGVDSQPSCITLKCEQVQCIL